MKTFLLLINILLLTGCGEKITTCNIKTDGFEQNWKYFSKSDIVNKFELNIQYDNSMFGVDSLEGLNTTEKVVIKKEILSNLGFEKDNYKGLDIDVNITDKIKVYVKADLEKVDKKLLKQIGLDFSEVDMNINSILKNRTNNGVVCK